VPATSPLTTPVADPTDAIVKSLLLHVPPAVPSASVDVAATQALGVPNIAPGSGLTSKLVVTRHPVPRVYVIDAVPWDTPVTTPVDSPTVATAALLVDHVPPAVPSPSDVVEPTQTTGIPVIDSGIEFTVTVLVDVHPVPLIV